MRKGSAILWLLIVGLGVFILFNVFKGVNLKSMFTLPSGVGSGTTSQGTNTNGTQTTTSGQGQNNQTTQVTPPAPPTPPIGFSAEQLSPYYKKVHIDSFSRPNSNIYPPDGGQFAIYADQSIKNPINVTGWSVHGNKGNSVIISRAIPDYNPSVFGTMQLSDITLDAGGRVYVYGWYSAFGSNFRLNKCTGYLNEKYKISPSLPNECPIASYTKLILLSGKCQDFVRSLSTCVTPKPDELNRISGLVEAECRTIISNQNHISCYNEHRTDAGFFSNDWRTWNSEPMTFDSSHDRIILFDKQGLVVDEYVY
ncbi:MAG: hypothetical protein WCO21_02650 [bacterium]